MGEVAPLPFAAGNSEAPRLAVLMATRNGRRFLDDQLASIAAQDWGEVDVWASDDGSTDGTAEALAEWAAGWRRGGFEVLSGPVAGFAANFRSLLINSEVDGDLVAFCDQDDIWLPDKTRAAAEALAPHGERPALYCTRTLVVDEGGAALHASPCFRRKPTFRNALVQSIGGGNTMVLNRAGHHLLREAARRTDFVSHDWFSYLVVTGAGGAVVYSPEPRVRYRQHGGNLVGSNRGIGPWLDRLGEAFRGRFTSWNDRNLAALEACRPLLTPDAIETMERFSRARSRSMLAGAFDLARSGVYRQTLVGQMSLYAACLLGKL
jgi:glycosyltransferase involved in cell wall biosynthesis